MDDVNLKDIGFKVLWTAISAALGVLLVVATDLDAWYAPAVIAAINAALAWVRQKVGATPPEAPPVGPLATTQE